MKITNIPINKIRPFESHPYKVLDDGEMDDLTESVRENGVLSPLIVRPLEGKDEYEVISGHRRLHAAERAGMQSVPAFVYEIDRDEAAPRLIPKPAKCTGRRGPSPLSAFRRLWPRKSPTSGSRSSSAGRISESTSRQAIPTSRSFRTSCAALIY